jgi:uncharacterized protein (DUF2236 family)
MAWPKSAKRSSGGARAAGLDRVGGGRPPGRRRGLGLPVPPLPPGQAGDPGLFGPSSVVWRVHRERALLLSAPAVALLQLAHPLIAAAVAEHTDRRRTLVERLGATAGLNLAVIFGDLEQAERAASHVRDLHTRIRGRLGAAAGTFPAGSPYRANDPELLRWGHATIVWAGAACYSRFVGPLTDSERDRYVAEARPFGVAFGLDATSLPSTFDQLRAYVSAVVDGDVLAVGDDGRREAQEILWPRGSWSERAAGPVQRIVAAGLLPEAVRRAFALPWGRRQQAAFSILAGATRGAMRTMPRRLRWWPQYRIAAARAGGP